MKKSSKIESSSSETVHVDLPHSELLLRGEGNADVSPHSKDLAELANMIVAARSRRRHFLPPALFAELAWEMLLALYRADAVGYRLTVSNLCRASEGPITTALRWIDKLEELGLVTRRPNPLDMRVAFIELTPECRIRMRSYLTETWTSVFATL